MRPGQGVTRDLSNLVDAVARRHTHLTLVLVDLCADGLYSSEITLIVLDVPRKFLLLICRFDARLASFVLSDEVVTCHLGSLHIHLLHV